MSPMAHLHKSAPDPQSDLSDYLIDMADQLSDLSVMTGNARAAALFAMAATELQMAHSG